MKTCVCIPDTFLPLINCRRQTIAQIIFPRQGNTAWINSITWYSLSTQCGQFCRRSAPFFYSRDNLVTSLWSHSRTRVDKQNHRYKVPVLTLHFSVDFSRWTDTWCGTWGLLCKPVDLFVFGHYLWCQGGCLDLKIVRWVEKYGQCSCKSSAIILLCTAVSFTASN